MEAFISSMYYPVYVLYNDVDSYLTYDSKGRELSQEHLRVLCYYSIRLNKYEAFKYYISKWEPYNAYHVHCIVRMAVLTDVRYIKCLTNRLNPIKFFNILSDILYYVRIIRLLDVNLPYINYLDHLNERLGRYNSNIINPYPEIDSMERSRDPFYLIGNMKAMGESDGKVMNKLCEMYSQLSDERSCADIYTRYYGSEKCYYEGCNDDYNNYYIHMYRYDYNMLCMTTFNPSDLKGDDRRRYRNRMRNRMRNKKNI